MAGRNIGHVEFLVDFDGDDLPRQARQIGRKAGAELGDGIDKGSDEALSKFGTRLRKEMHEAGRDGGLTFTDAFEQSINRNLDDTVREVTDVFSREKGFERFAEGFDSIGDASDDLDRKLTRLHETGRITDDQFLEMIDSQTGFAKRAREAADAVSLERKELGELLDGRLNSTLDDLAQKKHADADATERERLEYDRLEKAVKKVEFDRVAEQLDFVMRKKQRMAQADAFAAKEALREASAVEHATASHGKFNREGDRTDSLLRRIGNRLSNLNVSFRELPHGIKQVAGYTALFTALAPGIAVLGSVTGSGIVSLATGVGALGIAVAAMIPGFKGMLDDVEKLPPKARDAARAMQDFADPLNEMQDVIQEGMFDGLSDGIDNLRNRTLPRITQGMGKTAKTLNGIFDDMLGRLTSPRALGRIDSIFGGLQPILKGLGTATLNLGGAFSGIFEQGLDSGKGFASFLEDTTGDFNRWVNSDPGKAALGKWFDHLDEIMPRVGTLLGTAGQAISNLVTDEAVDNMADFLDTMNEAIPKVVGGLGGLIDAADPLGLLAQGVNGIGDFFSKNAPGMVAFGEAANGFVTKVGGQLGEALGTIGSAILDIAPGALDSIGDGLSAIGKAVNSKDGKAAISSVATALGAAADATGDLLKALGDSGAIATALGVIGGAADTAGAGLKLFSAGAKAAGGDAKGAAKDFKEAQNILKDVDLIPDALSDPGAADAKLKEGGAAGFWQGITDGLLGGLDKEANERNKKRWADKWKKYVYRFFEGAPEISPEEAMGDKPRKTGKSIGKKAKQDLEDGATEGLGGGSGAKVTTAASGLVSGLIQGITGAFDKDTGAGNVLGGFVSRLFGNDDQSGKAQKAGAGLAEAFKTSVGIGFGALGTLGGALGEALGNLFGGQDDDAKGKGEKTGGSYKEGVEKGATAGGIGAALDGLFDGDAGKTKAKGAGTDAKGSYIEGLVSGGEAGGIAGALGSLFDGDAGKSAAKTAGGGAKDSYIAGITAAGAAAGGIAGALGSLFANAPGSAEAGTAGTASGTAYTGGVTAAVYANGGSINLAGAAAANQLVVPFDGVPGRVGLAVGGTPGAVGGVMGQITGQPGADGAVTPFVYVPGRITGAINGTPGAVGGVMGQVTGKPGADNTVNPFNSVTNSISGKIAGTPGAVGGVMGQVTGKPGADNVVRPFNGVPGQVGGKVSGTRGAVSGALSGINDFGAAGRIIGAFAGVPGAVGRALSGLSGIVSARLGAAKAALSGGLAGLALPKTATGGMFDGAQARIIGEAGPEAVVPLNRPLSRVDPAVRDLSAIAQGKATVGGGARFGTYVAPDAIRVTVPNSDPVQVAAATVDRIIAAAT